MYVHIDDYFRITIFTISFFLFKFIRGVHLQGSILGLQTFFKYMLPI